MNMRSPEIPCPSNPDKICPRLGRISINYLPADDETSVEQTHVASMRDTAIAGVLNAETRTLAATVDCDAGADTCPVDELLRSKRVRSARTPLVESLKTLLGIERG